MESTRVHNEAVNTPAEAAKNSNANNNVVNKRTTTFQSESSGPRVSTVKNHHKSGVVGHVTQVLLRSLAALLLVGSVVIMLFFADKTYTIAGFSVHASYKSSPAFKFFVYASGVVGLYCILSLSFVLCCSFVHTLDMIMMVLTMAAASAATAVGYIGKFGNEEIGWMKVCDYVKSFCRLATVAVGLSYLAFLTLFLLCCVSFNMASKRSAQT